MDENVECLRGLLEAIVSADRSMLESLSVDLVGDTMGCEVLATDDELRANLYDYVRECCYANGVHVEQVFA